MFRGLKLVRNAANGPVVTPRGTIRYFRVDAGFETEIRHPRQRRRGSAPFVGGLVARAVVRGDIISHCHPIEAPKIAAYIADLPGVAQPALRRRGAYNAVAPVTLYEYIDLCVRLFEI